ncbi:NAD-dependent epimerase/dehydratase family protein [Lysobacter avium]|uniref:NAD-dependent epimerase/dehydratase family protein n=2 Tax=Novilysobacter avium TaxID=2781023 RepID=A0A7S6UL90_9GAMM|nr:NAD-dependent epimerase/dehydratase family protein [Lysobacter avium]
MLCGHLVRTTPMREALVFGGSGQIGSALLARLAPAEWRVTAVSRQARPENPDEPGNGVRWLTGELDAPPALPARVDAIFSCGPLDGFARWYAAAGMDAARVVAFGSTSVETKQRSDDPFERDLAARLANAEHALFARAKERGAALTILRPTLVYGVGRDANLTRIAALARRWGWFPLPGGATGLRQPVHVADLAEAALACLDRPASHGRAYAVPGGESLSYREMVARVLACLQPPARLLELPRPLFALALHAARISGRASGLGDAAIARMQDDLVFDPGPAQRDFDYCPRPFEPVDAMFRRP